MPACHPRRQPAVRPADWQPALLWRWCFSEMNADPDHWQTCLIFGEELRWNRSGNRKALWTSWLAMLLANMVDSWCRIALEPLWQRRGASVWLAGRLTGSQHCSGSGASPKCLPIQTIGKHSRFFGQNCVGMALAREGRFGPSLRTRCPENRLSMILCNCR